MIRKKTREYQSLLHEYAAGKKIQQIADERGKNYQWVYQRLRLLPDFAILRRVRRERERLWLQKKCGKCGELCFRNEFPPSHTWCKKCRRNYYREYHRRKRNEKNQRI